MTESARELWNRSGSEMSMTLAQFAQPFDFDRLQQIVVVNGAIGRLLVACLLGGAVGLEREFNRKAAGVRTNLLICMGAAFFTLLSAVLAGDANPDKGRVASNIVQGIGFLGAGLILHNRSRVSGLDQRSQHLGGRLHRHGLRRGTLCCGRGGHHHRHRGAGGGGLSGAARQSERSIRWSMRRADSDQTRMLESILDAMDKAGQRLTGVGPRLPSASCSE